MGQLHGKVQWREGAKPFLNLDEASVNALWTAFNDVAEGFGLNVDELSEMCHVALQASTFGHAAKQDMLPLVEQLFRCLDTDENNLIDSLETLTTLCAASAMELAEKAQFSFMCYDFDESGQINVDELTLMLKSCATGLCKLGSFKEGLDPPDEVSVERLARIAFQRTGRKDDSQISCDEFVQFCCSSPEILSWVDSFDDASDFNAILAANTQKSSKRKLFDANIPLEIVLRDEGVVILRSGSQCEARGCQGWQQRLSIRDIEESTQWMETARLTGPSHPPQMNKDVPVGNSLRLEWVYGYSGRICRNNVRYSVHCDVVYPAGALMVAYSSEKHSQKFMSHHNDEILSVAAHPHGELFASGERGPLPRIFVWDASSMEAIVVLSGAHRVGVSAVAFSTDREGRWLASIGQDLEHVVCLHEWRSRQLVFSSRSCRTKILDVCFREGSSAFVVCGEDYMSFWNLDNNKRQKRGIFGRNGARQSMLCVASKPQSKSIISGSLSGHIYLWDENRNLERTVKAHDSALTALFFSKAGLLSGGEDGKIRLWSKAMEQGAIFDVGGLGAIEPSLSSVCYNEDASKILLGTRSGEIFEISSEDGSNLHSGPIICGHFSGELHGLSMHPSKSEFCTVGDDKTVRIWDLQTFKLVKMVKLDTKARCCTYSPNGKVIAIGLGGANIHEDESNRKDGAFLILNEENLCIVHEARDSKRWISEIKFSADGTTLAVGSTDNSIYLYHVEDFASKGRCKGHRGPLRNLDFSEDNQCLRSNCAGGDLLFWSASTGEQYSKPSTMKDVEWFSENVPTTWTTAGIWKAPGALPPVCSDASHSRKVISVGDQAGRIRLFRRPCSEDGANFFEYRAHASTPRRLRFAHDDSFLVSVGQRDRCVMQWHLEIAKDEIIADAEDNSRDEIDSEDEMDLRKPLRQNSFPQVVFETKEDGNDDDAIPEKPWLRLAIAPSVVPQEKNRAPEDEVELNWVYGFNSGKTRGSIHYLKEDKIVYPAAKLAVVFTNGGGGDQHYFMGHAAEVTCITIHPTQNELAASGDADGIAFIWNIKSMRALRCLRGFEEGGVASIKFSPVDGCFLVCVRTDVRQTLTIHDWKNDSLIATLIGGFQTVLDASFLLKRSGLLILVQSGVKHIRFHEIQGRNLVSKEASFVKKGRKQNFLCVEGFLQGDNYEAIVGTGEGDLYVFCGNVLDQCVKAHEGSVSCINACAEGFASGGRDGYVKLWTLDLQPKSQFEIMAGIFSVRSLSWNVPCSRICIGTSASEILEISSIDGSVLNHGVPIVRGHCKDELWGLALHPNKDEFSTVGDDRLVQVWDLKTHQLIRKEKLDSIGRTVAYSPDGNKLAIGLGGNVGKGRQKKDGSLLILNERDLVIVHEGKDAKQWIVDVKFSSEGDTIAAASYDNCVYLYDVAGGYVLRGIFDGHKAPVTHIDFSADGQFVRSNCEAFDLKYFDASTGQEAPAASKLKDTVWATDTCPLDWHMKGIHKQNSKSEISSVHKSNSGRLVAFGDETGSLKIRSFPAISTLAGERSCHGHVGRVCNVRFSCNDSMLISVGGRDRCIMQWSISRPQEESAFPAGESGEDSGLEIEAQGARPDGVSREKEPKVNTMRPWISAVVPPTGAPAASKFGTDPPVGLEVELEFVYGHRSTDVRNNVKYNARGGILTFGGSVGIVYDKCTHSQVSYLGHDGRPIVSMAMHPSGSIVATGEGSCPNRVPSERKVAVHIWNPFTGQSIQALENFHENSASQMCFSPDGSRLLTCGEDPNHAVAVWLSGSGAWNDAKLQGEAMSGSEKVFFAVWQDAQHFVTGGQNHILFWTLQERSLIPQKGFFGKKGKIQPLLCGTPVGEEGKVVTGTVSGHFYVWLDGQVIKSVKAHDRSVNCIFACGSGIVSGSKDGQVKLWDTKLSPSRTFDMTEISPVSRWPPVRSVSWSEEYATILVGTQGSEIFEVSVENQTAIRLLEGHSMLDLCGLAAHPTDPNVFATVGDDQTLRIWDGSTRRFSREVKLDCKSRALCWNPNGSNIAVGLGGAAEDGRQGRDGMILVFDSNTLELLGEIRDSKECIADIKFSPNEKILAVASHDRRVYLYDVSRNFELQAKCEGHSHPVLHVDFSADSEYVRSNCDGYEMIFHRVEDGAVINSPSMLKDAEWTSSTCPLSWATQGIWPEITDDTVYNACDAAPDQELLVAADDIGNLRIFNFPAITKGAEFVSFRAHVSRVANARFNSDKSAVYTVGGPDCLICQWKIHKKTK